MKRIIIFFAVAIALGMPATAMAQNQKPADYSVQDKQQPDAIYRLIRESYRVTDSGTTYNYRKEITILRNRTLVAYADKGETFITYNPAFETLTINECYTIQKDGTRVETPQNAFVLQLPSNCTDCARFSGLREMAIVHTGMELGCTIVLDYTIHRKSTQLFAKVQLTQDCPVERYELTVEVPARQIPIYDLNSVARKNKNIDFQTFVNDPQNGTNGFKLVASNLEQSYVDAYLPANEEIYPTISFCNDSRGLVAPKHWLSFNNHERCSDAQDWLARNAENDPIAYATVIHSYVVNNVNLNRIDPALLNYKVASAKETWHSNCGTAADKAQLLSSMLRQAGIASHVENAERVIFETNGSSYYCSPISKQAPQQVNVTPIKGAIPQEENTILTDINEDYAKITLKDLSQCPFNPAYLSSQRVAPLQVPAMHLEVSYNVGLPKGSKVLSKMKKIDVFGTDVKWEITSNIKQEGNRLLATRTLIVNEDMNLSGEEYRKFRQALIEWYAAGTITIKK